MWCFEVYSGGYISQSCVALYKQVSNPISGMSSAALEFPGGRMVGDEEMKIRVGMQKAEIRWRPLS